MLSTGAGTFLGLRKYSERDGRNEGEEKKARDEGGKKSRGFFLAAASLR